MKKFKSVLLLILSVQVLTVCTKKAPMNKPFGAYYTNVGATTGITGKYADIVVNIDDDKEFVFCKESGYLPYLRIGGQRWPVAEIFKKRTGNSQAGLDEFNQYSYVRIIENSADKIIVHWRYIPDLRDINFRSIVHEYFILTPDRKVSRMIRSGNMNLDIYNNPESRIIQEMKFTRNGIRELSLKAADTGFLPHKAIKGFPLNGEPPVKPVAWWKFDEGLHESNDATFENIGNIKCPVTGNITLWKKGISGTALAFDGYDSKVVYTPGKNDLFNHDFTIEAWVVLGAYPWEWGPVMDYTSDDKSGVYFGVNSDGRAGIRLNDGEEEAGLISDKQIPLYKWTHVAANYNKVGKLLGLYIDGEKSGEIETRGLPFKFKSTDLFIGLNKWPRKSANHVSRDYPPHVRTPLGNQARIYGIEGLLDEVRIFDKAMTGGQIDQLCRMTEAPDAIKKNPDLEKRILPGQVTGGKAEKFGAYYTRLKFHELWDNLWRSSDYPDVVVKFDELPVSIVYWRGTNYGPAYVTENNIWMSDQSSETGTTYGCAEHMADKQNRYSHVRIIENTPARIVVHWRYASADVTYQLADEKSWTDEYHSIYPDGTLLRYVHWYTGEEGFQDLQFLSAPGTKQEDNINLQAMTIANVEGDIQELDWSDGIPVSKVNHATIALINFKSRYKVFAVFPKETRGIRAWGVKERATPETYFAGPWNHWPVGQMPNDGNYSMHDDRVSSSALGGSDPRDMAMYGFTDEKIQTLIPVDKSWNQAPGISDVTGAESLGYEREKKAYSFIAKAPELSFTINAGEGNPLQNPCFEIDQWNSKQKAVLLIDGKVFDEGKSFRQGIALNQNGKEKMIIWLKLRASSKMTFEISRGGPPHRIAKKN